MYVICFFLFLVPKVYDIDTVTHTHTHVTMLLLSDFSPVRVNSLSKSDSTLHGETNEHTFTHTHTRTHTRDNVSFM